MISSLNDLVDRTEKALAGGDPAVEAADVAARHGTTEYHLRRMFASLAGMPLSEYIRRRRMTLAAADLISDEDDLLTIAVRFGYGSAEAFSRAFRAVHDRAPTELRQSGGSIRTQHVVRFRLTVEGSTSMDAHIVERPDLWFAGHAARVPLIYEGVNPHITEHVESVTDTQNARLADIAYRHGGTTPEGIVAVSADLEPSSPEGTELTYLHGVTLEQEPPQDLDSIRVPAGPWAVFHTSGPFPETLQSAFATSATDWFPSNPWRLRPGPSVVATLEMSDDHTTATNEIWMPIERDQPV